MSRENVEALRRVYDQWAQGNFWTPEIFDPEVQTNQISRLPDIEATVGLDDLARSAKTGLAAWKKLSMSAQDFREVGDRVVVIVRFSGIGRTTGLSFDEQRAHVWTMRNGKAMRFESYASVPEALEAVGLRE